jgi:integrase
MASIQKRGNKWRAFVLINGVRESKTFDLKKEAVAWGNEREEEGTAKLVPHTFRELVEAYKPTIAHHKGVRSETYKIDTILSNVVFADLPVEYITKPMIAAYRDARLQKVAAGTVQREMAIMAGMFSKAIRDWGWLKTNPVQGVIKPTLPAPRRRGISQDEIDTIVLSLESTRGGRIVSQMFQLSLETGLRLSEMTGLTWDRVKEKFVILPETKNGDRREVPLSTKARAIIASRSGLDDTKVFPVDAQLSSVRFNVAKKKTPCKDVRFHDARSEAVTRLSRKLDVMQLAKMIGHRDLKSLMGYYAESSDSLADRL